MTGATVRRAEPGDFDAVCRLNQEEVLQTSPLDPVRLQELHHLACYHGVASVAGTVCGFVLAMDSHAAYDNENFQWFARRYPRFLYIDRVVVAAQARGRAVARALYSEVFDHARHEDYPVVCCEYNLVPANEASRRFHAKWGFTEQGVRWVSGGGKQVSMQAARVTGAGRTRLGSPMT